MTIRIGLIVIGFSLLWSACNRNKAHAPVAPPQNIPQLTDTFDLSDLSEESAYRDGLFDDFIYHFVSDADFQKSRILFPLPISRFGKTFKKEESEWKFNHTPSNVMTYAMLFTSKKNMELEKDTTINCVDVDCVYLPSDSVKKFSFCKVNQEWRLKSIHVDRFSKHKHGDFYQFYGQFVTDSTFQFKHIRNPFIFETEDEYSNEIIEGSVNAEAWPEYSPDLPSDVLVCIHYESARPKTTLRYLVITNLSEGLSSTLRFESFRNQWKLTHLENY